MHSFKPSDSCVALDNTLDLQSSRTLLDWSDKTKTSSSTLSSDTQLQVSKCVRSSLRGKSCEHHMHFSFNLQVILFSCHLLRKGWVVLGRYKAEIRCKLDNTLLHFCAAKLHSFEHMYIQSHDPLEQTRHVMRGYRHYNIPNIYI